MKKHSFMYRNSLSIFALTLFLLCLTGQTLTGWNEHNQFLGEHGAARLGFLPYLSSGHFMQATFENFESEFLQMFLYVLCTVSLRQWGSSESKSIEKAEDVDRQPVSSPGAPWPVRKGGWILKLYKSSLSLAFLSLFIVSWALHAKGSYDDYVLEEKLKNRIPGDFLSFLGETRFWFESFQNWQSEFLSIAAIVILSIFLRQYGSPESKPVDMPHSETP